MKFPQNTGCVSWFQFLLSPPPISEGYSESSQNSSVFLSPFSHYGREQAEKFQGNIVYYVYIYKVKAIPINRPTGL
jgi:hypothetical protein